MLSLLPDPKYYYRYVDASDRTPTTIRQVMRDRALILATMHQEPIRLGDEICMPLNEQFEIMPEQWEMLVRSAKRCALLAFVPWRFRVKAYAVNAWRALVAVLTHPINLTERKIR